MYDMNSDSKKSINGRRNLVDGNDRDKSDNLDPRLVPSSEFVKVEGRYTLQ